LVKDLTDDAYAVWTFEPGNPVSDAVFNALRNKDQACVENAGAAWMPDIDTSQEPYCGTGEEGGCDSFVYANGGCVGLPGWSLELDGDLAFAKAAFKYGWTYSSTSYCEAQDFEWDHGYLDELGCYEEFGELYYR
jgi:hypothetical protein